MNGHGCTPNNTAGACRVLRGYAVEWGGRYPDGKFGNDFKNQFSFLPGSFDASIARGGDIALTQDLNGVPFARRSDGTLRITSDEVGLLVEADLLDTPRNRVLCQQIDAGKVKGWSHKFSGVPSWGRVRSVNGVQLTEYHSAELLEVTLVVRKRPRQLVRATPIFLTGGRQKAGIPPLGGFGAAPEASFTKDCCCEPCACPCQPDDGKIVEVTIVCHGGTVVTQSQNSSAISGSCEFIIDDNNGAGCAVLGSITCSGGTWTSALVGTGDCDPCICADTATTVNSCDPIDVEFVCGGVTVTVVEL